MDGEQRECPAEASRRFKVHLLARVSPGVRSGTREEAANARRAPLERAVSKHNEVDAALSRVAAESS